MLKGLASMSRTTDPVLELKGRSRGRKLFETALMPHMFFLRGAHTRRGGEQFREGMKQARRPSHGKEPGVLTPFFCLLGHRRSADLPRHETAWFGCERRAWRELEGIGAPGADDRSVSVRSAFSTCVSPLRRRRASPTCPLALSGDRHRVRRGRSIRSASRHFHAPHRIRIGMAPRTRAAIKPSLTDNHDHGMSQASALAFAPQLLPQSGGNVRIVVGSGSSRDVKEAELDRHLEIMSEFIGRIEAGADDPRELTDDSAVGLVQGLDPQSPRSCPHRHRRQGGRRSSRSGRRCA